MIPSRNLSKTSTVWTSPSVMHPRRFDFVIGADGLHSVVRSLTFEMRNHSSATGLYGVVHSSGVR